MGQLSTRFSYIRRRLVKANPWRASTLLQYLDIVYKVYSCLSGTMWLHYNKEFHMKAALNSVLYWDQIHYSFSCRSCPCPAPTKVNAPVVAMQCTDGHSHQTPTPKQIRCIGSLIPKVPTAACPVPTGMNVHCMWGDTNCQWML